MSVFWPETAVTLGAESLGVCGVVKMALKRFQIDLMRLDEILDGADVVGVSTYSDRL